jgi:hypothetical protein
MRAGVSWTLALACTEYSIALSRARPEDAAMANNTAMALIAFRIVPAFSLAGRAARIGACPVILSVSREGLL